ncbi:MAG: adenylate/guanylate cyclase domain-containing protein [Actinomycetota bacterium]
MSGNSTHRVGLLERLADIGARPGDPDDERLRSGALILATVGIATISFVWVITYLVLDEPLPASIPALYQVVTLVGLVVLARTKRFDVYRTTQLTCFLALPALLQASLGGFVASSGMVLWCVITPLAALAMLGWRRSMPWLVAFFAVLAALTALDPALARGDPAELPSGLVIMFFVLNISGLMLGSFVMLAYFVHQRELAHSALEAERERSERLLLNVLPAPIAEQLKRHEGVIAEQHDDVTVLFADLVGFTAMSAEMDPATLVGLLDEIFSSFDTLADAEGLEKIKTIGDAYMVAGGLPAPRSDHAEAVARVALAMRDEVAAISSRIVGGSLSIRIGIDTGPVVAGVIGRRKFIYDLWGDTVNTASRMESHGLPGRVQVTARAAARLEGSFELEPRGTIDVKGKGPMETCLIIGPV